MDFVCELWAEVGIGDEVNTRTLLCKTIRLPFVPFPELAIELAGGYMIYIVAAVNWSVEKQRFVLDAGQGTIYNDCETGAAYGSRLKELETLGFEVQVELPDADD